MNVKIKRYVATQAQITIILYKCETWSVILQEANRLREFQEVTLKMAGYMCVPHVQGRWEVLKYFCRNTLRGEVIVKL
jgi:hypothetical protein